MTAPENRDVSSLRAWLDAEGGNTVQAEWVLTSLDRCPASPGVVDTDVLREWRDAIGEHLYGGPDDLSRLKRALGGLCCEIGHREEPPWTPRDRSREVPS